MSSDPLIEGALSAPLCTAVLSEKPYGIVYRATHVASGKVYVGQTIGKLYDRRKGHVFDAKTCGTRFGNALKKHGSHAFVWDEIDAAWSREELDAMECHWISFYHSTDRNLGYNLKEGGANSPLSKESRLKMSETKRRQYRSGERQIHNREAAMTAEQRETLRQIKLAASPTPKPKGRHKSQATEFKPGEHVSKATEFPSVRIQCVETGRVYETLNAAARELGISHANFSMYFRGKRKSVAGRQWIKL